MTAQGTQERRRPCSKQNGAQGTAAQTKMNIDQACIEAKRLTVEGHTFQVAKITKEGVFGETYEIHHYERNCKKCQESGAVAPLSSDAAANKETQDGKVVRSEE